MPRGSRHRSHRSHKHGHGDYSGSDVEGVSKERKPKDEDLPRGSGARVSRDLESEKGKSSHSSQVKELHGASNGYASGEHGKKWKERDDDPDVPDRWKSSGIDEFMDEKRSPEQVFGPVDVDKSSKLKRSADSKSRSSRRQECPNQRNGETGGKAETGKRRSDKDWGWRDSGDWYKEERMELSRRESSDQYKEREKKEKERGLDKDNTQDSKRQRSEDAFARKNTARSARKEEVHMPRKDVEVTENHVKDDLCPPVMEKDFDKHVRRRNDYEGEVDDRKLYYKEDDRNSRGSKYHWPDGQKYKDKYRDDVDRDRRRGDERRQDDRSSGYHTSDRYDGRNSKDESKSSESRYKKSRLHDKDDHGDLYDDHGTKDKETRVRKRFSEDTENHGNLKTRNAKEQRQDMENTSSSRFDLRIERPTLEHRHSDKVDYSPNEKHTKSSPTSSSYQGKDQSRHRFKLTDSANKESLYEERIHRRTSATVEHTPASRHHERIIESRLPDKFRSKDDASSHDQTSEVNATSQYDSTLRLDKQSSANQATDKSPLRSDQRFTGRTGANLSLQTKVGQKSSGTKYKDRESNLSSEKPILDYHSQYKVGNREPTHVSPSMNRTGNFSGSSPNHLQHPSRLRNDDPSLFSSYDDDNRSQIGDRKNYGHPKRSHLGAGRGRGNAWNNAPAWPPSVANGFLPLQHGPPSGFIPAVRQVPGPPPYGVRPPMQFSSAGIPYHMHDSADRFSGHVRAYGWPNQVDESFPSHLQIWDGNTSIYGSESHVYGGNRGWEVSTGRWNVQDNMNNIDFPVPQKELEFEKPAAGQPGHQPELEQHGSECVPANHVEAINDTSQVKSVFKSPSQFEHDKKRPKSLKVSGDGDANFCGNYLSRINVSPDLVGSELYGRCTAVLKALNKNGARGVLSDGCPQDIKEEHGTRTWGTSNALLHSLFSSNGHSVFQRAVSLYKKQTDTVLHSEGKNSLSEVHNEQKGAANSASHIASMRSSDPNTIMDEEMPLKITDPSSVRLEIMPPVSVPTCAMESGSPVLPDAANKKEEQMMAANVAGDHPVDAEGQKSDLVGDGSVFNNASQDCEAMTEAVNLSRMPNSPESTH